MWIAINKELPPYKENVLCIGVKGGTFEGMRTIGKTAIDRRDKTVWMWTKSNPLGEECTHWWKE